MKHSHLFFHPVDSLYNYMRKTDAPGEVDDFKLHNHTSYELFIFLEGDVTFYVEGSAYQLKPFDVLVIRDNEMHRTVHLSKKTYRRIVVSIQKQFFDTLDCKQYQRLFTDREVGEANLIRADYIESSGFLDAVARFERYMKEAPRDGDAVLRATLVEMLHILSKSTLESGGDAFKNDVIKHILAYINQNITEPLSLDDIADAFFISKCHLCRMFKAATGFTIHSYITNKRIMLVRSLCRAGKSIGSACMEAGFGSYSNFYKTYVKETGLNPRTGLRQMDLRME